MVAAIVSLRSLLLPLSRDGGLPDPGRDGPHAPADTGPGLSELQDVRGDGRVLVGRAAGGRSDEAGLWLLHVHSGLIWVLAV